MASNIVIAAKEGGGATVTLYGNEAAAAGNPSIVWTTIAIRRRSPWEIIEYTGHSTIDAKYMGGKTRELVINGRLFGTESELNTNMISILDLNKNQSSYTVSGPFANATSKGVVVTDIVFEPYGAVNEKYWKFTINLRDIAV
jgi:hypothetical protein